MPAVERVRLVCRADALMVGDQVLTPSRRWETMTCLDRGEPYSRSVRMITDLSGPAYPWVLLTWHPVHTRRRPSTGTSAIRAA